MTTRNTGNDACRSPFGELLQTLRTRRGLTQERLAQATDGDRISSRSITSYESSSRRPRNWVLPHRTGLKLLIQALDLDMVDQHSLVVAWDKSRKMRDTVEQPDEPSSFVEAGREEHVNHIMQAWSKAQTGTPQIVFINGVSGVGKSALAKFVSDTIAASTKEVMITWGGASSWATDIEPYLAIRAATDRILEKPDPASALPGLYPTRPPLQAEHYDRVLEAIPLLGGALISERSIRAMASGADDTLTAKIDAQLAARTSTETSERLEEYCRLLVHFSRSWPVVMVLEDLHWAGDPAATLLMYLIHHLREMRDTPILIIGTYRNDEIRHNGDQNDHPFSRVINSISHAPHVSNLALNDSMSPTAGMSYVRGVIAQAQMTNAENAGQLAEWMYSQTSGHPLLTGELMHHLVETGALRKQDDSRWAFNLAELPQQTPAVISTFIEQRISRTSRQARRILDIAAVMDDIILTEIIAEIMQTDDEEILEVIDDELVDHHSLLLPGTPITLLNQSHTSYRFPHNLYREHIYGKLPSTRRRRLHSAIAQAMEQRYSDADTTALSEITSHYVMAEDWQSAQIAGYRQAQDAVMKLDWDLAEVWFQQAEDLALKAQDPMQLWRTRASRLALLRATGQYDDALELGEHILETEDTNYWPATIGLTYHHLGEVFYDLGKVDKTVEYLQKAVHLHIQEDALDLAAAGYSMLSHASYRQGKYDVAHDYAQAALKLSGELKNSWVQPEAVLAAANCEIDLGYYEEAIRSYEMSTELAIMAGRLHNQFIPPMNIGLCHIYMGNFDKAIELLTELISTIESQSIYRLTAPPRLYLGYALEAKEMLEAAAKSYSAAADIRRDSTPLPPTLYDIVAGQLRVAMLQKDDSAARQWLTEIVSHLDQHSWEGIEDPLLVMMSVANASRYFGDERAYREYIERAHALIMERASMIENTESRTSYLTNVPINVKLQQLHASLGE